jgi:O-glycosyl hydrolase
MKFSMIDKLILLSALVARVTATPTPSSLVSVSVNPKVQFQEIDGFGASQAFQRAEDIFGKYGLPAVNQTLVLNLLYDKDVGAGFTILRNGIGSSNTSNNNFMNSIEPKNPGSPDTKPEYVWDHYNSGQFPLAQQAYARGLQTLYADAWSAPGYMKTNDDENNGGYLCGVTNESCASGNWMQAYANYLVQYARFYKDSGVDVTHLGFLNEPQFAASYAGMLSNGTQAAEFIRVLAKTIKKSGLSLKINCCDGIGWDDQEAMMVGLKAGPDPAINYIDVVTGHGYDSAPTYPLSTNKKTWQSEWADLTGDFTPYTFYENGGPGEGLTWANHIQVALRDAEVSGFLYWIGAENSTTNSGLINLINNEVIPSKRFWAFAQFSKFVRPGARRIAAASSHANLTVSSFKNKDGRIATQLLNQGDSNVEVSVVMTGLKSGGRVKPYLTNNDYDLEPLASVSLGNSGSFKAAIPAWSMVTYLAA